MAAKTGENGPKLSNNSDICGNLKKKTLFNEILAYFWYLCKFSRCFFFCVKFENYIFKDI